MPIDLSFLQSILPQLLAGAWITIQLTVYAIAAGVVLGLVLALLRISKSPLLSAPALAYIEFFRGTPLLVQIFMIYFGLGSLGVNIPDFFSGFLALSLNSAAYDAEIFRAGIQSISKGQMEASRSLGLSYTQSMAFVIIPQAFRFCLPPLGNEFIALLKDSSLVAIIGISDLMRVGREINGRTLRSIEVFGYVAIVYLLMTLPLSQLVNQIERRMKKA
ncbi:MAG: amino acid ABC transporter permease [Dehalococcoidales bacterium]|nr:amino acid ABC transporter permease [Dehalococcoidales bacterium]